MIEHNNIQEKSTCPSQFFERLNKIIEGTPVLVVEILKGIPYSGKKLPELEKERLFSILDDLEYLRLDYNITDKILKKYLKEALNK